MKAHVLADARLRKQAGRFVWLDVDAEKDVNAAFTERFPTEGYPTFMVIDPAAEKAVLKWPGSASVKQFERLLDDGLVALREAGGGGPEAALARADRSFAEGKPDAAAAGYREALARGGGSWERRSRALDSLMQSLNVADRSEECAAVAVAEAPALRGASRASVASNGLSCALGADKDAAWRAGALATLEPLVRAAAGHPDLLADDRAWILQTLAEAREDAGDAPGARRWNQRLWRFLEAEARRTPSAELRASLDTFRTRAAIGLGKPALAIPALRASEKALPGDYNPCYRLAMLYKELGESGEALAAADRALARAYGPRKLRVYDLKASILERQGDAAARRATLEEAVRFGETLPDPQRKGRVGKTLERWREELAGSS